MKTSEELEGTPKVDGNNSALALVGKEYRGRSSGFGVHAVGVQLQFCTDKRPLVLGLWSSLSGPISSCLADQCNL